MYSLILMTAMAGTPDTTEFNGFFRNLFSFGGCHGSCSGRSSGCTGSCHGHEFGSRLRAFSGSCNGRSADFGSCRGYACSGSSYSCNGGTLRDLPLMDGYAQPGAASSQFAPSGCYGMTLGTPMPYTQGPMFDGSAQPYPAEPPLTIPPASVPEDPRRRIAFASPGNTGRATVVVKLPSDATLYAEGQRLSLTSGERTFVTPPLPQNEDYSYAFRVEYVRGGETITQAKKETVRAGRTTTVEFSDLTIAKLNKDAIEKPVSIPQATSTPTMSPPPAGLANLKPDRARITVKLPPGATLYVDGKKNERTDAVREFNTPPLPPGQEFAYLMKAEVLRDGRPETQTTKVNFRAGEIVSVDFTAAPK